MTSGRLIDIGLIVERQARAPFYFVLRKYSMYVKLLVAFHNKLQKVKVSSDSSLWQTLLHDFSVTNQSFAVI
jgi:hypothetical protein